MIPRFFTGDRWLVVKVKVKVEVEVKVEVKVKVEVEETVRNLKRTILMD